jgi:hypothetical protein
MYDLIWSTTLVCIFSHSKENRARYKTCVLVFGQRTRYSCSIFLKFIFLDRFSKVLNNFTKIRPVGAKWFHADGHDEANSPFSQFYGRLKLSSQNTVQTNLDVSTEMRRQWCAGGGGLRFLTAPPRNYEVLTKPSLLPCSLENTSLTT